MNLINWTTNNGGSFFTFHKTFTLFDNLQNNKVTIIEHKKYELFIIVLSIY